MESVSPPAPDEDGPSDTVLLTAHVAGDDRAFDELARRHRQRLYAMGVRLLRDRHEAEDAVQDALVRALRSADTYRGESTVAAWLGRIMSNVCLTRLASRRAVAPLVDDDGTGRQLADARGENPFDEIDDGLAVRALLAALPEEQRIAILLVNVYGLRVEDVARMLGVSAGTIKSRCARGRARLAAILRARDARGLGPGPGDGPGREEGDRGH